MAKVSISIESLDSTDKKVTDKISYVNPQATDEQLVQFAKMLNDMTTDDYISTTKITEEVID